jgi:hypothetical protein
MSKLLQRIILQGRLLRLNCASKLPYGYVPLRIYRERLSLTIKKYFINTKLKLNLECKTVNIESQLKECD